MRMRKISVIGLGYVGLPTAVVFASKGFNVVGVDIDVAKVESINNGRCYLSEPGLDVLLRDVVSKGFLRATTDVLEAVKESDAVVIAFQLLLEMGSLIYHILGMLLRVLGEDCIKAC